MITWHLVSVTLMLHGCMCSPLFFTFLFYFSSPLPVLYHQRYTCPLTCWPLTHPALALNVQCICICIYNIVYSLLSAPLFFSYSFTHMTISRRVPHCLAWSYSSYFLIKWCFCCQCCFSVFVKYQRTFCLKKMQNTQRYLGKHLTYIKVTAIFRPVGEQVNCMS